MLGTMFQDYDDNLYVDYIRFGYAEYIFEDHTVNIFKNIQDIPQKMIPCYNRPAFTDFQYNSNTVNIKVHIYPTEESYESWLVFDCNKNKNHCILKTWFRINIEEKDLVPIALFTLGSPGFYHLQTNMYTLLFNVFRKWDYVIACVFFFNLLKFN